MRVFLVKFAKFLRTPNLKNIRGRLFLPLQILQKYQDLNYFSRGKKKYSDPVFLQDGQFICFFSIVLQWQVTIVKTLFRRSCPKMFSKKGVLKNFAKFTGKHLCQSVYFNKVANFIKKETLAQVFSCEFLRNF